MPAESVQATAQESAKRSWREALLVYRHPRVLAMLFLGFSAGLPFLLIFSTLSVWLREADISRTEIGFFSWIGITFSIKVVWAPIIDRTPLPLLTRLCQSGSTSPTTRLTCPHEVPFLPFDVPPTMTAYRFRPCWSASTGK